MHHTNLALRDGGGAGVVVGVDNYEVVKIMMVVLLVVLVAAVEEVTLDILVVVTGEDVVQGEIHTLPQLSTIVAVPLRVISGETPPWVVTRRVHADY